MSKEEIWLEIFRIIKLGHPERQDFVALKQDVDLVYAALIEATDADS